MVNTKIIIDEYKHRNNVIEDLQKTLATLRGPKWMEGIENDERLSVQLLSGRLQEEQLAYDSFMLKFWSTERSCSNCYHFNDKRVCKGCMNNSLWGEVK